MGRTIPSFRIASSLEEKEWKSFRNSLDKSDRKIFDDMFLIAHLYNSASLMLLNQSAYNQFLCLSYFIIINSLESFLRKLKSVNLSLEIPVDMTGSKREN